jgi:hypothetical protein
MSVKTIVAAVTVCMSSLGGADARPRQSNFNYDGAWHLAFETQAGPCDPAYAFDVNISNGRISHPNLVKFYGSVDPNGRARASVAVHDKFASGSGRLSMTSGRGAWKGRSGSAACSGFWTARREQ